MVRCYRLAGRAHQRAAGRHTQGADIRARREVADDSEQLGARRGDVDLRRPQRPHLGAARAAVDSRGAARERGAAGARVRRRGKAAGELGRARRRAATGPGASTASSSTRTTSCGSAGAAGWPRPTTPGVSDDMILKFTMAGQARHADRPQRTEQGQHRHGKRASGRPTSSSTRRRRRSTSPTATATSASSCSTRKPGSSSGCGARSATRRRRRSRRIPPAPQPQTTPDGPPEFGLAARDQGVDATASSTSPTASTTASRCSRRDGKFLKQVRVTNEGSTVVPVPAGFAFSPDTKQQFLYVVDSGPMRVVIFDRADDDADRRDWHARAEAGRVRHRPPHGGRLERQSLHRRRSSPTAARSDSC